jgi:hypothetical protein
MAELLEDVFGAHALGHLRKLRLGKFPRKPVKASISCNIVGERVGKSSVEYM